MTESSFSGELSRNEAIK